LDRLRRKFATFRSLFDPSLAEIDIYLIWKNSKIHSYITYCYYFCVQILLLCDCHSQYYQCIT